MNYPCSMCGSRDWPSENTTCPLCRAEPEPQDDDEDTPDALDESQEQQPTNNNKTQWT